VVICFNKLDLQVDSQKIIQHLLLLSNYSIDLIEDYVNDQLNDHVIEKNIRCFRQCVKLWQMTQTQADEQIHSFRGKLVFKLLKFVDHENPLMRYAARNWLQVSTSHLYNILDLVFANLLENTEFEFKPEVIHTVEYPTVQVNRCIKFMKDMLIVMGDVFSSYMATQNCTPRVAYLIPKVGEKRLLGTKSINYLDLLSVICLRYVEGTTRDTNSEFYIKNLSVKATFCEFLEMLLSKHPGHDTVYQISFYLLEPLSVVLKKSVERDESSVLIQILSVLRFILFRSNIQHDKSYKEKYFEFLQKKGFIDILVKGLSSIQLYIVIEFKDFINSLITVTSEYLRHPQLTQIVSAILSAYYSLISSNSTSSRGPKEITMASPNKNTKM
jgi:hypothetical protein